MILAVQKGGDYIAQELEIKPFLKPAHNSDEDLTEADIMVSNHFEVTTLGHVDWYIGKLADLDNQIERVKSQAAKRIRRIETEKNQLKYFFGQQVERVSREAIATEKRKSIILDNGDIKLRHNSASIGIVDEEKALMIAKNSPSELGLTKVSEPVVSVNKKAMKEFLGKQLEDLKRECEGDILEAERRFNVLFPFAKIEHERDVFSISYETEKNKD